MEKCHLATACAHKEDVNGAKSTVNGFIEEIAKSDAANNDAIKGLLTDLTGQVRYQSSCNPTFATIVLRQTLTVFLSP